MRRRLKTLQLLTLALVALSADASARLQSQTPATVLRGEERFFKDAIKFESALRFADRKFTERNEKYKYDIGLVYPQLVGAGGVRVRNFNRVAAALMSKEVANFHAHTRGAKDRREGRPSEWEDVFDTLYGDYDVTYASDELISIRFDTYTFGWGAVRSTQHYRVFNYVLASGRRLVLSDLFRTEAKYLRFIADFCLADLRRQRKAACADRDPRDCEPPVEISPTHPNLSPLPGNFRNWNLTRTGLLLSFDECRLTSCLEGEQFVTIPYAELKHLAPARGHIARLAGSLNE